MTPILDRFTPSTSAFRPKTLAELFGLRLAQKLGDANAASHYARLASDHPRAQLLAAYRRAVDAASGEDLAARFHVELKKTPGNGGNGRGSKLMAVRVERRSVAAAIFQGEQVEYTQVRQLSSANDKALGSAVGFVNWMVNHFPVESATLESIPNGHEFQRQILHDAIMRTLGEGTLPVWQVAKTDLFQGYGYPPLKSRKELREVATTIWPILQGTNAQVFAQDAAVLGLHVQVERLFLD